MSHFTGLIAATLTPFKSNGDVEDSVILQQVDFLASEKIAGIFTCGTTGESASLQISERKYLAECYAKASAGKIKHIVHVGHNSVRESCELASHAESVKADAIATVASSYFKVSTVPALVDCCNEIAKAAPQTPFYYYHIPSFTGAAFDMIDFLKLASQKIKTFAGIKYTHFDFMDFQMCQKFEGGKYNILFGRDEFYLGSLAFGSTGAVGSTYNYMAPLFHEMEDAFVNNDHGRAQELQHMANRIINLLKQYGGLPTAKTLMRMRGIDTGPCRLPNMTHSTETERAIIESAKEIFSRFSAPAAI